MNFIPKEVSKKPYKDYWMKETDLMQKKEKNTEKNTSKTIKKNS